MRATTNGGNITIPAPAGGLKSGKPVFISGDLAGVPQSDYAEGDPAAIELSGIECTVECAAPVAAYVAMRINAAGVVSAGAKEAGYAKLGVTKFASRQLTRPHVVTQAEADAVGGPYSNDEAGDVVDETYNVVKIIVQGI